jgi:hypothetical protein
MMENGHGVSLSLIFLIVALLAVVVALVVALILGNKFRSKTKIGPVDFELDADPSPHGTKITARNIKEGSIVTNEGGGGPTEINVQEEINGSTVKNTKRNARKD